MPEVKVLPIFISFINFFISFKAEISSKIYKNCVEHVKHVKKSYWKTDRTIDTKLNKLRIALEVEDNKDDNSEYSDSTEEKKDECNRLVCSGCFPIYFIFLSEEFYCHSNSFPRFSPIKMISYTLINRMVAES